MMDKRSISMMGRRCYGCGDNRILFDKNGTERWCINPPTNFFLCTRCYDRFINVPRQRMLIEGIKYRLWKRNDRWKYRRLHELMEKKRNKPRLCEKCHQRPPRDICCMTRYNQDARCWRWWCKSCHNKQKKNKATI